MKPKIPAIKVKSDECAINVGQVIEDGEIVNPGTPYYVHEGEWVELLPVITVKEVMHISKLQSAANGETENLGENLTNLCKELSRRLIAWNWTNLVGEPLEQPFNRPDVLEELSSEELMWLMGATSTQESADARKKGSAQSENTSLEMALNPSSSPSE